MTVLYVIIGLIVLAVVFVQLFLAVEGKEKVTVHTGAAWELESKEAGRLVLKKKLVFANEGKQCATIMDAIAHLEHAHQSRGIRQHIVEAELGCPHTHVEELVELGFGDIVGEYEDKGAQEDDTGEDA